jgi:hypothetical protein
MRLEFEVDFFSASSKSHTPNFGDSRAPRSPDLFPIRQAQRERARKSTNRATKLNVVEF